MSTYSELSGEIHEILYRGGVSDRFTIKPRVQRAMDELVLLRKLEQSVRKCVHSQDCAHGQQAVLDELDEFRQGDKE